MQENTFFKQTNKKTYNQNYLCFTVSTLIIQMLNENVLVLIVFFLTLFKKKSQYIVSTCILLLKGKERYNNICENVRF